MINPYFKEQFQEQAPNYAQAVAGATNLVGQWSGMAHQGAGLGTLDNTGNDNGIPSYGAGQFYNNAATFKPQHTGAGEIVGGALQGAGAGAAFGPLGAGIGALVGLGGTIFAGNRRRHRQEQQKADALSQASAYQQNFNTATQGYNDIQMANADYRRRLSQNYLY